VGPATARRVTRTVGHSARSEAQSQNPLLEKRVPARGPCDFAQGDIDFIRAHRVGHPNAISAAGAASMTTWKLLMLRSVSFSCSRICRPVAWGLSCEVWASEASVTA
jgi:hypothetical protein